MPQLGTEVTATLQVCDFKVCYKPLLRFVMGHMDEQLCHNSRQIAQAIHSAHVSKCSSHCHKLVTGNSRWTPTYGDIVANDSRQGSVLCVVLSYMDHAVILYITVVPDLDAVDVT